MAEQQTAIEQTFVQNEFGTVTNRRVISFREKGWFSGGSREDIPLQHVTSVRLDIARSVAAGIVLFLLGLGLLGAGGGTAVIGILVVLFAILLLWGSPMVVVNTAGRDLNAAKGFPWQRSAANGFVEALRQQLFAKAAA